MSRPAPASAIPTPTAPCHGLAARWAAHCRQMGATHPIWYYSVPSALWLLAILWCSLAPARDLPTLDWQIPGLDKLEHGTFYAVLGFLLLRDWLRGAAVRPRSALAVWLAALLLGIYLELMQGLTGYREMDPLDALSNGAGALLGVLAWRWLGERLLPSPAPVAEPPKAGAQPAPETPLKMIDPQGKRDACI